MALKIYAFQKSENHVYGEYIERLFGHDYTPHHYSEIPFLPIVFFKTHSVKSGAFTREVTFKSSGTTSSVSSQHFVKSIELYEKSFLKTFKLFFGNPKDYGVLGLLPSYLERGNSSLVFMVNKLIQLSRHPSSGFYLNEFDNLASTIEDLESTEKPTLLFGVTYALLDFFERHPGNYKYLRVIETGGMKGQREELTRKQVQEQLTNNSGIEPIYSEYGMTELLSQAYSLKDELFKCPPWMRVLTRSTSDPLSLSKKGKTGGMNVIDLANIYSCSFIATQDLGRIYDDHSFHVLGRFDHSDIRGCNLLVNP